LPVPRNQVPPVHLDVTAWELFQVLSEQPSSTVPSETRVMREQLAAGRVEKAERRRTGKDLARSLHDLCHTLGLCKRVGHALTEGSDRRLSPHGHRRHR
jgi:hypothetical protein